MQSGPEKQYVTASGPLDGSGDPAQTKDGDVARRWYASVEVSGAFLGPDLKVFAVCSPTSKATIEAKTFHAEQSATGEDFAVCPGKKRALGGGVMPKDKALGDIVAASGPLDASGVTLNTDDGDKAKQWYAAQTNNMGGTATFKVFAICE